ncbi:unnamed protein product [Prorocentrum cordatum]|uniref:Apple domain-containing protein n=1 Tax=Prorocentrum cordatum TaxID=2364126 RepID=A0ABN9R908_9DINO|nr:unnamed protein product [Polarella glacialis]
MSGRAGPLSSGGRGKSDGRATWADKPRNPTESTSASPISGSAWGLESSSRPRPPALAPVQFVHVSGPANRVCKGKSLWTGKAADEDDDCEQKCADLEACRFISLSSNNLCRLTATCDSTWHQDGKKVWIFSRSRPALVEERRHRRRRRRRMR